jgi:hypothetical protein
LLAAIGLAAPAGPDAPPVPAQHVGGGEPDGLLVLAVLSPERAMVADPRTGATRQRRLAGGTLCHGPVLAIGDRVVLSGRHLIVRSLPLSLSGPGRSLGAAEVFTASRTRGRVWLGHWDRPRVWTNTGRVRASLHEVDAAGRPVAHRTLGVPTWGSLEAVVDDGFLVSHDGGLSLQRDASVTRTFRDAWLVAAEGSRFAWCRDGCRVVRLWSPHAERLLDPPTGVRPLVGRRAAFSPDGRRLAVPVRTRGRDRVAVIDLASGRWHVIPGRLTGYGAVAWSPSGRWLYFTGSRDRVLGWRGGRPVPLPIDTGGAVMSIATTPSEAFSKNRQRGSAAYRP